MKRILALILVAALSVGLLCGCVAGKTAMLFVEDVESETTRLLWAGFESAAKKLGMKPVLSGLTEEQAMEYNVQQIWEQDIAEHEPDVMAVVGLSDSELYALFLNQEKVPVVAVDPVDFSDTVNHFCVYSATDTALANMAAQNIIGMQLPSSGRIRLLYNRDQSLVCDTFTGLLEAAGYYNIETTPLSGRVTDESLLNNFTEDTVGIYNASDYDTSTENLNNLILCGTTAAHLNALVNDQASSILSRNEFLVGDQTARACADALRGKEITATSVEPILITANGPDENGSAYWLDLLS